MQRVQEDMVSQVLLVPCFIQGYGKPGDVGTMFHPRIHYDLSRPLCTEPSSFKYQHTQKKTVLLGANISYRKI